MGACLNQQPTVGIVVGPPLPVTFAALKLDNFADVLERQVERRLPKLLHELAGVRFVARCSQLVVDCQAHVVSLARSRGGIPSISAALPLLSEPASVGRLFKSGGECASFCESTSPSWLCPLLSESNGVSFRS
jgi:hypothetical protein